MSLFPRESLEGVTLAYSKGESRAVSAVEQLIDSAELYFALEPFHVTEKSLLPPSGDRRDYMTLSPYWWPNPDSEDGLPYVRRDGERNPEVYNFPERENCNTLGRVVRELALLYAITGEERYAERASLFIREWFLDAEHGMNPNMNFAQGIPGRSVGRGSGIIDSRRFSYAVAAVPLLRGSKSWSDEDEKLMREWAKSFLEWMQSSENGMKEMLAKNNHGLWYDAIRLIYLRLLDNEDAILELVEGSLHKRLDAQIAADGTLPKELERTLSLHYSTFALEAIALSDALLSEDMESLWCYRTESGGSLESVVEYLAPYYLEPENWPHQQIAKFDRERGARILYLAGGALGRGDWIDLARKIGLYNPGESSIYSVLYYNM